MTTGYVAGDPWFWCDRCGFKRRRSDTRKEWTGLIVCKDTCYEPRHPQDKVRGLRDREIVRDARPEPEPVFLSPGDVTPDGYS